MKINIDAFMKKQQIRDLLVANANPKYELLEEGTKTLKFEVTDVDGTAGDLVKATNKIIKSQPWGAALVFRVLVDGQAFTGQKL